MPSHVKLKEALQTQLEGRFRPGGAYYEKQKIQDSPGLCGAMVQGVRRVWPVEMLQVQFVSCDSRRLWICFAIVL